MDINLGDNQFTTIHLQGLDAANQEGKFTMPPKWTAANPSIVTITPSPDGVTCRVEATSPPNLGSTTLTVEDMDDPGVPALTFNVTITGETVSHLGATIDPPQEKGVTPTPAPTP